MNLLIFTILLLFVIVYAAPSSNSSTIQTRIYKGKAAKRKNFPYQARISSAIAKGSQSFDCGGTLISDQYVLTGAHCVFEYDQRLYFNYIKIILGDVHTHNADANRIGFVVDRTNVIIHEKANLHASGRKDNDIALIMLPRKIQFNDYIKAAELPKRGQGNLVGKEGKASGWGNTSENDINNSEYLLYTKLQIMDDKVCSDFYSIYTPKQQLCIKGKSSSNTCPGDSGGPFVIENKNLFSPNTYTVVGIVSYGDDECDKGSPEVVTNVHYYLQWISKKTGIKIK